MQQLLRLEQQLMRRMVTGYQRRLLRSAVQRAFRTFAQIDPDAASLLFDEHFVRIYLLPRLYEATQTGEDITACTIAEVWARRFSILPERRQHYIADICPVATRFLRVMGEELAQQKTGHVRLPCVEATAAC